jgi:hypothetical protein
MHTLKPWLAAFVLAWLNGACSQEHDCEDGQLTTCTSLDASTCIAINLLQAVSFKRSVSARDVEDLGSEGTSALEAESIAAHAPHDASAQASATSETDSTSGMLAFSQALRRLEAQLKSFCASIVQEFEWFAEDFSQNGVTRRSSGIVMFLVLILLILGALYFYCTGERSSAMRHSPRHHDGARSPSGMPSPSSVSSWRDTNTFRIGSKLSPGPVTHLPRRIDSPTPSSLNEFEAGHTEECILVVPVSPSPGNFTISDLRGSTVLHGYCQTAGIPRPLWQMVLQTPRGVQFGKCIELMPTTAGRSHATGIEFNILDDKDEYFASLVQLPGKQRYQLTTQTGDKLHFWGNFQTQAVNITDENGAIVAVTEPCQAHNVFRLRMAHFSNAGLPLCAMLCIGEILRSA